MSTKLEILSLHEQNLSEEYSSSCEHHSKITDLSQWKIHNGKSRDRRKFTAETRDLIRQEQDNRCAFLGTKEADLEIHHIIPRAHGGTGARENGVAVIPEVHRILDELAFNFNMYFPEVMESGQEYVIGRLNAVPKSQKNEVHQDIDYLAGD